MTRYNTTSSSIDPSTFVNALAWDQLRREVAQRENRPFRARSRVSQRDPALAAVWSCLEGEAIRSVTPGEAYRIVLQDLDMSTNSCETLERGVYASASGELEPVAVDACFEQCEAWLTNDDSRHSESEFDRELELLESVQQISLEIRRGVEGSSAEQSSCIIRRTGAQAE